MKDHIYEVSCMYNTIKEIQEDNFTCEYKGIKETNEYTRVLATMVSNKNN